MTLIMRHRWTWSGFSGAPGVSTFYGLGTGSQAFVDGIKVFLTQGIANGAAGPLPTGVSLVPDGFVDIINDTNGSLSESQSITPPATIPGAGGAAYGSPMGLCITWTTGGIALGPAGRPRRVRGRTFLVPLVGSAFDSNGTFNDTKLATLNAAAAVYVAGSWNACVWHRPFPPGGANGSSHRILSGASKDKAAVLTSRRD